MSLFDDFVSSPYPRKKRRPWDPPEGHIPDIEDAINLVKDTIKLGKEVVSDPETEGKEEGYNLAVSKYMPIYQDMKRHYEKVIQDLEETTDDSRQNFSTLIARLQKLEAIKSRLEKELEKQLEKQLPVIAQQTNTPEEDLKRSVTSPSFSWTSSNIYITANDFSILDWIHKKRRAPYVKKGYEEAEAMYKEKMDQLRQSFEYQKSYWHGQLREYALLIYDTLQEIKFIKERIANLQLLEKLGEDE